MHLMSCDHIESNDNENLDEPTLGIPASRSSTSNNSPTVIVTDGGHNDCHVDHSHQDSSKKVANGRTIALRDFFTVLALSFHAVFEGLAIGLEPDSADIWILFAGNKVFTI